MKITLKQAMLDLMNVFLGKIVKKEIWKQQDIINAFHEAQYEIAMYYIANDEEKKEIEEREHERMLRL